MFPKKVTIVEVSPRDGLQNETKMVPTDTKIDFINQLSKTGLRIIEATSFVSPKWIPQLADQVEVFKNIEKYPDVRYPVLIPNVKGLENALEVGVKEIAVFTSPSEEFSQRNTNCSVQESLDRIHQLIPLAKLNHLKIRGYISCVLGCPYQGEVPIDDVVNLATQLIASGCDEISLSDTIGVGTPLKTKQLLKKIKEKISVERIGVHFHDTYGQALANIYVALEEGIHVIDSSVAGLGGCPYAKGASGNVATEDVVYMLQGMNIDTGIDLSKLIAAGNYITNLLQKPNNSKVSIAFAASGSIMITQ